MFDADEEFLEAFEKQTLPFSLWSHEAHLRMAFLMLKKYRIDAPKRIIEGIQQYNRLHGDQLKIGYHETITRFWIAEVAARIDQVDSFQAFKTQYPELFQFAYIYRFYQPDRLFSELAKTRFIPADEPTGGAT